MRDMLLAAEAPAAEAHCLCPQCHHNADSQRWQTHPTPATHNQMLRSAKVHKHDILWLASLTDASEFHLYYDIQASSGRIPAASSSKSRSSCELWTSFGVADTTL